MAASSRPYARAGEEGHTTRRPGVMREHGLQAFRVMLGGVNAAAVRHAHHQGQRNAAARAMTHAGHVVRDLIHGGVDEPHELDLRDGAQALARHADGHAGDHAFGERSVLHAILAEFFLQAGGGAEHAAIDADVFTQNHHCRVVRHFPRMRVVDGLDHRDFRHGRASPQCPLEAA